jgi:agmatine/peptidylarginine deiminase
MYRILFLIVSILISTELPKGLTDWELQNMHIIDEMKARTDPPPGPVRNIAEFEPMQGVLIRYPFGISTSVIREMAEDVIIYCLVSSNNQTNAYNSMNNAGVDMNKVEFILGSTDSYWTRDYGPWWVVDGNRDVSVVDHVYNRPRPNDNQAPLKMSNHLNTPYFSMDLEHAGGNYMTDGYGISASSSLVYAENSENDNQVDQIMEDYYGIHTYHVIDDPNGTYIDHIDCWGKYLSPHKVLIREVPTWHSQYDEIEEVVEYFNNTVTTYGEPWEIFRVYTSTNQPYTNSLILNDKVLVPIVNNSYDDDALAVYQEALPGYEVLGFTGSWESTDALHCRAKGIPDLEMLQIFHNPLNDYDEPQADGYEIMAIIDDLSETGLNEDDLRLFWKNDSMESYIPRNMGVCDIDIPDCYQATIPPQVDDTNIYYKILASDYSGRYERLPMAGYYTFSVVATQLADDGDVNMDDSVNVQDIIMIINYILGQTEFNDQQKSLADLNNDGLINIQDIILVINLILND